MVKIQSVLGGDIKKKKFLVKKQRSQLNKIDIRKNYKIKYKQEHQHAVDQLPSNVFTWKADYAESTSTHNTGSANYVHTLYGDAKTPPQENNDKIRTTVYGYPALIFHRIDTSSELEFIGRHICRCKTLSNIRRKLCGQ